MKWAPMTMIFLSMMFMYMSMMWWQQIPSFPLNNMKKKEKKNVWIWKF